MTAEGKWGVRRTWSHLDIDVAPSSGPGGPGAGYASGSPSGNPYTIRHTRRVGLNPFRAHRRRPSDYVLVGVTLAITLALVLWAAR
jgi:hypothetical protein